MMDEQKEVKPRAVKEAKPKAKPIERPIATPSLINWKETATGIETELEKRGWSQSKHRKNPRYLQGLIMRMIVGPLVKNLPKE